MDSNKSLLATRIYQMRKKFNLTQEELALKLGLKGKSSIANYESGNIVPSDEVKYKMCQIFGCSMDYLMGLTNYKNPIKDLEAKLYELNLSEDDYDELLSIFLDKNRDDIEQAVYQNKKINAAFQKCLELVFDYNDSGIISIDKSIDKIKNIIKSLDKYKIVHNSKNIVFHDNKKYYMCPVYGRIAAGEPNWAEECLEGYLPIDPNLMNIVNPEECFFLRVNGESMNKVIKNGAFALIRKQDIVENGEIAAVLINGHDATLKKFTKQKNLIILEPMSDNPNFTTQVYNKINEIRIIGKYIGKMEMN